ncbi:hypothetical protein F5B22DRAFT_627879 [Xylaria bambusicola]|uniref:uncharacterized protein n=1 Tax=Xylaria bambusicola TaxID=326684 RepID=UPI0020087BCE|nr:uncharacterized protein F5B22DRAFT_627879 [Xylaria bambusicola]KAI0505477.1 hypothetical protein F5B22DRAFT_627879 [Xylaria bambusicola]
MTPPSSFFAFLALCSAKVLANPTAALLGDLLDIVSLDVAPLITEVVTTTYPASTPTTYTTSTYDTSCQCHYSTIFWWTPHPHHSYDPHPYPTTSSSAPGPTTVTVTETTTVPTTTTVTATATVTEPCTPTLTCDKYGYLIQAVTLYQVDLSTGDVTVVKDHLGDDTTINAMAYNTLDNFLYARQRGNNELIRISSDGTTEVVTTFPDNNNVNIGDIDTDGNYWYAGGDSWYQIDLRPGSATYGTLIDSGKVDNLGLSIADWAYLPVGGPYLYSAAHNTTAGGGTTLIRFSLDTKKYEVVQRYPNIGGHTWGAMYAINNGTLYASDNTNGEIWAFPIEGGSRPYLASQGPISGQNDGARCVLNLDV